MPPLARGPFRQRTTHCIATCPLTSSAISLCPGFLRQRSWATHTHTHYAFNSLPAPPSHQRPPHLERRQPETGVLLQQAAHQGDRLGGDRQPRVVLKVGLLVHRGGRGGGHIYGISRHSPTHPVILCHRADRFDSLPASYIGGCSRAWTRKRVDLACRVWLHCSHASIDVCRVNGVCPYKRIIIYIILLYKWTGGPSYIYIYIP